MRIAYVLCHGVTCGQLSELDKQLGYEFQYDATYVGPPISLTMPLRSEPYYFKSFPPFFDGLLPEGSQLEALLRKAKLDRTDYFSQLITVGGDCVGAVTVAQAKV